MGKMNSYALNGITQARATIYFPKTEEQCKLCPLLQTYSRNQCMLTGELIADTRYRGYHCPLEFEEETNGEIQTAEG